MQKIYLARPGAQKEGPFTLEQINHDLATKKISDTDFWAWHEGLPAWAPLHSIPGVSAKAWVVALPEAGPQRATAKASLEFLVAQARPEPITSKAETAPVPVAKAQPHANGETNGTTFRKPEPAEPTVRVLSKSLVAPEPQPVKADNPFAPVATPQPEASREKVIAVPAVKLAPEKPEVEVAIARSAEPQTEGPNFEPAPAAPVEADARQFDPEARPSEILAAPSMSSGKPIEALEQIFVFTTGEGPSALKSKVTAAMVAEAVGRKFDDIQATIPVDVVRGTVASVVKEIRAGSIPASAWRALFKIKHAVAQQIHEGVYHLCVRTFPVESKDLVALFLLYNKQKL